MSIEVEVSYGELADKITILQIKTERIADPVKLENIRNELKSLLSSWDRSPCANGDIGMEMDELRGINEKLWEIEDAIREKEARGEFDERFIELARLVYLTNDKRAAVKKSINRKLGSTLFEEKSYTDYQSGR